MSTSKTTAGTAMVGGGVGGALGVLAVLFMPADWYIFTPESAAVATAAFGVIFSYAMRWLPAPGTSIP